MCHNNTLQFLQGLERIESTELLTLYFAVVCFFSILYAHFMYY